MCGIIGLIDNQNVSDALMLGLQRMEYRGYDSAGIAVLQNNGTFGLRRMSGNVQRLRDLMQQSPVAGNIGIGHIRWATHGRPDERNAHPHVSGRVAVVHNGIIENFATLRADLQQQGRVFLGDTDTEVVAHLADMAFSKHNNPHQAVVEALAHIKGAYALLFLFEGHSDLLIGARQGSPLAALHHNGAVAFGSDAAALSAFGRHITYLEEGDICVLTPQNIDIYHTGHRVQRATKEVSIDDGALDKTPYRHFMEKEIFEQSEAVARTLSPILAAEHALAEFSLPIPQRLIMTGCGTAYYAALTAQYWCEELAKIPTLCDIASELRYRHIPLQSQDALLSISQSGETADTLAAMRHAAQMGVGTYALVNVPESTLARESQHVFYTHAGVEVGVASTKAFTCQLSALLLMVLRMAADKNTLPVTTLHDLFNVLRSVPRAIGEATTACLEASIAAAGILAKARDILYLGRGSLYPIALEGALKLKEITYLHAEGYAAGELKHGPIALIDSHVPVVILAPSNHPLFEKTLSALHEVQARGAQVILLTDAEGATHARVTHTVIMPDCDPMIAPIVYAVPLQLMAYHTALLLGTDADRPRNLAKSVTVE